MKFIGAVFLFFIFVLSIHAQDLFDQAEIEFDVDYIDIDNVQILGDKNKGRVMVVWMKSGSVLTKTLLKSNIRDTQYTNLETSYNNPEGKVPIEELEKQPKKELISMAYDLINSHWHDKTTFRLFDIIFALELTNNKGFEFVELTIDVIKANLEYGLTPTKLFAERIMLLNFAKGDEQLTEMANIFLEENGFKK